MKILENEVDIYFSNSPSNNGNYSIHYAVEYQGIKSDGVLFFHDSSKIDELNELKSNNVSFEEIQRFFYDNFYHLIENKIIEFCYEIDNN